jgi:hypothetical protein
MRRRNAQSEFAAQAGRARKGSMLLDNFWQLPSEPTQSAEPGLSEFQTDP